MTARARTEPLAFPPRLHECVRADSLVWLREGDGFVAQGEAARIDPGIGEERFARAARELSEFFTSVSVDDPVSMPGSGPIAFVSFTFDPLTSGSAVVVPAQVVARRGDDAWSTEVTGRPAALDHHPPAVTREAAPDERAFTRAVARARGEIRAGWLAKVVLAREVRVGGAVAFDVPGIVRALAREYPECFTFAFEGLVGASPELLVRRTGSGVSSLVLAGSARRGATPGEDARLGEALLVSDKERSEHAFAVASTRDVLELVCGELDVDAEPSLLRLANVQHLATAVRGELTEDLTVLELAGRLHPTAAVCGVPTTDALAIIRSWEGFDRGRYAGPIGWMDARGDGEMAIALRCAEITGNAARLFAGAGIVADSDPESELEETKLKLRAMQHALGITERAEP